MIIRDDISVCADDHPRTVAYYLPCLGTLEVSGFASEEEFERIEVLLRVHSLLGLHFDVYYGVYRCFCSFDQIGQSGGGSGCRCVRCLLKSEFVFRKIRLGSVPKQPLLPPMLLR